MSFINIYIVLLRYEVISLYHFNFGQRTDRQHVHGYANFNWGSWNTDGYIRYFVICILELRIEFFIMLELIFKCIFDSTFWFNSIVDQYSSGSVSFSKNERIHIFFWFHMIFFLLKYRKIDPFLNGFQSVFSSSTFYIHTNQLPIRVFSVWVLPLFFNLIILILRIAFELFSGPLVKFFEFILCVFKLFLQKRYGTIDSFSIF